MFISFVTNCFVLLPICIKIKKVFWQTELELNERTTQRRSSALGSVIQPVIGGFMEIKGEGLMHEIKFR